MKYFVSLCFISLISLTGCATAIPDSENVVITKNKADIKGCKLITQVYTTKKMIRNLALVHGGDTALLQSSWLTGTIDGGGMAVIYNCNGIDNRQPIPVQVK